MRTAPVVPRLNDRFREIHLSRWMSAMAAYETSPFVSDLGRSRSIRLWVCERRKLSCSALSFRNSS